MRIKPKYKKHPDPELNGNPLTEAIQPLISTDEILRMINFTPEFSDNFHELPRLYKNLNIHRISEIFVAPKISVLLYEKCLELILDGYRYRNPLTVKTSRFVYELSQRKQIIREEKEDEDPVYEIIPPGITNASTSILSGPSGTGKTSTLRAVLDAIPPVFTHTAYETIKSFQQDQIVWLSFDAPSTSSMKALCLNFMDAVDKALNVKRYYEQYKNMAPNTHVDMFIAKCQEIAANHYIGLVHIDEMQFFLTYTKDRNSPTLKKVEAMFNKIGIPVIMSTTREGLPLLNANLQTQRRLLSEQHFKLYRLKYGTPAFNEFIESLFLPEVWGDDNVLENQKEFITKFYQLSAGLQAVMIRLARLHLFFAVQKETHPFDIKCLETVFKGQFHHMQSSLDDLLKDNTEAYERNKPVNESGKTVWCPSLAEGDNDNPDSPEVNPRDSDSSSDQSMPAKSADSFHNPSLIGGL